MQFRYLFSYVFIACLAILPLLSPGLEVHSLAVEPETYKTAFGVGFAGFLLLFWLLTSSLNSATKIVKSSFYLPVLAFLVWNIISFIWLVDVEEGLLATLQYLSMGIAFFLVLNLGYDNEAIIDQLFKLLVIAGLLVAILGLLQYYFIDSHAIQTFSRQAFRPASTFGNKNMSTHFLVLVLPISLVALWQTYRLRDVIFYTTTSVVMSWFLTHTYTRGGWVALAVELFFLILFFLLNKFKKQSTNIVPMTTTQGPKIASKNTKRLILALGLGVYLLGANYTEHGWGGSGIFVQKVNSIIVGDDNGRLPAWTNTLSLIKDHWLIGVGSGNWLATYPLYYDSLVPDVIYNERVRLRRLHNTYLEMFSNVGAIGYAFLLWLLFLTIRAVSKILLDVNHHRRYLILGVSLGLIGFSISALVSFPLRVYLPGVLVLSYIGIIATTYAKTQYPKDRPENYWHSSIGMTKLLVVPLVVLAIFLAVLSYKWTMSVHYHQKSVEYRHAGHTKQSLDFSIQSIKSNPYKARSLGLLGQSLTQANLPLSIEYLERSVKYNPNNSLVVIALAVAHYQLAVQKLQQGLNQESNKALDEHSKVLKHLIDIDSRNVKGHLLLTRYYLQTKQIEKAKQSFDQALRWQKYFKGRSGFGPYDGFVNAIHQSIKPHLTEAADKNKG